jgi:DNA-binding MarR family transcriptional regulator
MRKQLNELISKGNLSRGEYLVLRNIWMSKSGSRAGGRGRLRAASLSEILELSRPSITRILNTLESRGFITRSIDEEDRRSVSIELTELGIEALEKANQGLFRIAERLVGALGEADTDKLIELLEKLADIFKGMAEGNGQREV